MMKKFNIYFITFYIDNTIHIFNNILSWYDLRYQSL